MQAASIPRWKRGCTIGTHQSQYRRFSNITRLTGQLHPPQMMMDTDTCCNKVIIKGLFSYLNENTYFVKIFWQPLPPLYPGGSTYTILYNVLVLHIHNHTLYTVPCLQLEQCLLLAFLHQEQQAGSWLHMLLVVILLVDHNILKNVYFHLKNISACLKDLPCWLKSANRT